MLNYLKLHLLFADNEMPERFSASFKNLINGYKEYLIFEEKPSGFVILYSDKAFDALYRKMSELGVDLVDKGKIDGEMVLVLSGGPIKALDATFDQLNRLF